MGAATWEEDLSGGNWKSINYQKVAYTLIPYSPSGIDSKNGNFRSPFGEQNVINWRFRHWLGTDALGRDVAAGMIRGCRIALIVGLFSMFIALLIGVPFGAIAGYFGDDRKLKAIPVMITWVVAVTCACWYFGQSVVLSLKHDMTGRALLMFLIGSAILAIGWAVDRLISQRLPDRWLRGMPVDFTVLRGVEIVRSMPAFFLLFALLALIASPSIIYVVLLIGLLRAPTIVRYVRAETMKIRDLGYIDAARVIGLNDLQIIRRHIVPNVMGPVMITVAFGIGGAVLLESGLSFLGIGLSIDQMSWGRLLNEARSNFSAWWLAVLPGLAIFATVAAFNRIGEDLTTVLEHGR